MSGELEDNWVEPAQSPLFEKSIAYYRKVANTQWFKKLLANHCS